jgi:hypothetical protein
MKKQNKKFKEVIINVCYGGFGLSELAYKELIKLGVPVRKYIEEKRNPKTKLYDIKEPSNEGEVIFDRELTPPGESEFDFYWQNGKRPSKESLSINGRYWETWIDKNREHPLVIKVIKKLGKKASNGLSELKIVKIPADVEYTIEEYDGAEHIAEKHKTWG